MAQVQLGRALLSLLADPAGTQVVIPHLTSMSAPFRQEKTFVRFVGDTHPTAWRGEGREESYALTCLYTREEDHAALAALQRLLKDVAPAAPDSRLLLRTHAGLVPGLNTAAVGEIDGDVTPVWSPEGSTTVSLTFRLVQFAFQDG